ncbi:discoidin domain-containing protein [Deinococcus cellulosilyticus]|uniref:Uncharacterized protein n=1 Tax=Deinococcus cellulosilyticus (strain DSM 18568 / NBRC 106333 / KACC 11606 / 5516J-15) TaxID=1223518 RepID=A0A511N1W1_DEIC1|nr:discoidin domain-containing protein [Deinococcus cellulosilyticus]GEM46842.1 hypothetical protein DC3_24770 [Deinococcus cellulosilyticus NBRC 106333 = KACC 11606]
MLPKRFQTALPVALALILGACSQQTPSMPTSLVQKQAVNLALGKPTSASTFENPTAFKSGNAVDGVLDSRWASAFQQDNQWLSVDLGAVQDLGEVQVFWEAAYATSYRIDLSDDGTTWRNGVKTVSKTSNTDGVADKITLPAGTRARFVRVWGLTRALAPYGYSIRELQVFAPTNGLPTGPTVLISDNQKLYASTTQDRGVDPSFAGDGNLSTRWASGIAQKAWLMMDLGAATRIDRVELNWETAWSSQYTLEVSNDRQNWTVVSTQTNPQVIDGQTPRPPASEYTDVVTLNLQQAYRYIRVNSAKRGWSAGDGSQWGISLYEFRVYGAGGADNPPLIPEPTPTGSTWTQVWADEFDSNATPVKVNTTNWNYEIGDGCAQGICGWGNGERQYYTDSLSNVFQQNGLLNIVLRKNDQGRAYTSGRITTAGKKEFLYGRIQARIKMNMPTTANGAKDGAVGVWGAFWMLGFDVNDPYQGWPNAGEIDIMENIGYSWWHSSSLHGPGYYGGGSIGESYNKVDTAGGIAAGNFPNFRATDWHDYEVEWDNTKVLFKLDNQVYRTILRSEVESRGYWVFNRPNFILLNVAYDGAYPAAYRNNPQNFTGAKTAEGLAVLAENNMPHSMQVDYVRVFQKK